MTEEQINFTPIEHDGHHFIMIHNNNFIEHFYVLVGEFKQIRYKKDDNIISVKDNAEIEYLWKLSNLNKMPAIIHKGISLHKNNFNKEFIWHNFDSEDCLVDLEEISRRNFISFTDNYLVDIYPYSNFQDYWNNSQNKFCNYIQFKHPDSFSSIVKGEKYRGETAQISFDVNFGMKITPLGIGNANPKNKYGNSCFLLEADKKYLIDFPRIIAPDLEGRLEDVRDIFITHVHNDHLGSLVDFLLMRGPKENREERINIYAIEEVSTDLIKILDLLGLKTRWNWSPKKYQSVSAKDFANLIILDDTLDATHHIGGSKDAYVNENGLRVVTRHNMHGDTPCAALKFIYKGKKIGVSGDCNINEWYLYHKHEEFNAASESTFFCKDVIFETGPNAKKGWFEYLDKIRKEYVNACIGWFDDCDLIFHEVTNVKLEGGVHTHISDLEKDLSHLKDKLFLYHVDDNNLPKSNIFPIARRGQVYRI